MGSLNKNKRYVSRLAIETYKEALKFRETGAFNLVDVDSDSEEELNNCLKQCKKIGFETTKTQLKQLIKALEFLYECGEILSKGEKDV